MAKRMDNFLEDELRPKNHFRVSYWDGFRFGFGFLIAWLLGGLLVTGASYLVWFVVHPH
jgi:hypothetical protein